MLLLARTTPSDQCKKRSDGMSVFLIDMNEAKKNGMSLSKIDAMINHNTCEVFFDNLEIPADTLIGEEGKGFSMEGVLFCRCFPVREGEEGVGLCGQGEVLYAWGIVLFKAGKKGEGLCGQGEVL
jgi:hypothetical protein